MSPRTPSYAVLAGAALLATGALPLGLAAPAGAVAPTCAGMTATIVGTNRADDLTGTPGPDVVYLGAGGDRFDGLGGDDVVCGGTGNDILRGGDGDDALHGDDGSDDLAGQAGDDTVSAGAGLDQVVEGAGDDTLLGGADYDRISYFAAGRYSGASVRIDVPAGRAAGLGTDTLSGFERYELTRQADTFRGGDLAEAVDGVGGDDTITTAVGDDHVLAGVGAARISTGPGDDVVAGRGGPGTRVSTGEGDDIGATDQADVVSGGDGDDFLKAYRPGSRLDGGAGTDTLGASRTRASQRTGFVIDLAAGTAQVIGTRTRWALSSVEDVSGSPYDDRIRGTSGPNVLSGRDGDDLIDGRGGDDVLDGGRGENTIVR